MHRVHAACFDETPRPAANAARSLRSVFLALLAAICCLGVPPPASSEPLRIVVLGDSLTAGLGLSEAEAFPARLQAALRARGHDVAVINAGVSGDTASAGLARVDWATPEGTDAVIVELGANDALRGIDPAVTRDALDAILRRLAKRDIPVLLAGMHAPRNLGRDYVAAYDRMFPELAKAHGAVFYRFFLEGVVANSRLNQKDGVHPNAAGVQAIVDRILPSVEQLIARVRRGS